MMWADQICSDISDYLLNSPSLGGAFVCEAPLDAPQSWRLPLNTFTLPELVGVHTAPKTSPAVGEIDPDSSASSTGSRGAVEWTASYHNPLLLSDVPYTAIQEDGGRHVTADERVLVMECQEGLNPANEKNCGVYVADGAFGQQQSGRMSTYRKVGADGKTLRNPAWYWIHNNDGSRWEYISGSK